MFKHAQPVEHNVKKNIHKDQYRGSLLSLTNSVRRRGDGRAALRINQKIEQFSVKIRMDTQDALAMAAPICTEPAEIRKR